MNQSESITPDSGTDRKSHRVHAGIVSVGAALALVLAGLGVAGAQTSDSTSTSTTQAASSSRTTPNTASGEGSAPPAAPSSAAQADDDRPKPHCHHGPRPNLAVAASTIGISEADLMAALHSGQSIAQVAQAKNVDPQKVIDALIADAKAKLAEKVQSGEMTQAQADEKAATLDERITEFVNRTGGPRPGHRGPRGPRPEGGRPAAGQQAPAQGSSTS